MPLCLAACRRTLFAVLILLGSGTALATDVNVVGLFPGKAVVSINGGTPRTLSTGQKSSEGVVLVSTSGDSATFDIDGKRRNLRLGEAYSMQASSGSGDTVTLSPDSRGHYNTVGMINGRSAHFMVDTGASIVWFSTDLATRLGIPWLRGQTFTVKTAGGEKQAWRVQLDSVRVGNLTLTNVDAAVGEGPGTDDMVLLGMSFLSRVSMFRDGSRLVLSSKESAAAATAQDKRPQLTLQGTGRGVFATTATINGVTLPFLVDTGATSVSIDAGMARQIGINYTRGTPVLVSTANGNVRAWQVKFDSVAVGPIILYGVDGTVRENDAIGAGLLGMTFLNRLEMRREGESLTLIKRY